MPALCLGAQAYLASTFSARNQIVHEWTTKGLKAAPRLMSERSEYVELAGAALRVANHLLN